MIEAALEQAVIAALKIGDLSSVRFEGVWQPANDAGKVKGLEPTEDIVEVGVATSLREYETFTSQRANVQVSWSVASRLDRDATGERFHAAVSHIIAILHTWQMSLPAVKAVFALADTAEAFAPCGFRLAGARPTKSDRAWIAIGSFTLRGIISDLQSAQLST